MKCMICDEIFYTGDVAKKIEFITEKFKKNYARNHSC